MLRRVTGPPHQNESRSGGAARAVAALTSVCVFAGCGATVVVASQVGEAEAGLTGDGGLRVDARPLPDASPTATGDAHPNDAVEAATNDAVSTKDALTSTDVVTLDGPSVGLEDAREAGSSAPRSCDGGGSVGSCDGACVDLASDDQSCGACGNACAAGSSCSAGECVPACAPACPLGNACAFNSDCGSGNCIAGTCAGGAPCPPSCNAGSPCVTDGDCVSGNCSGEGTPICCAATETSCAGVCVDLETDTSNCGNCGSVCGGACAAGRCIVTLYTGSVNAFAIDATNAYVTTFQGDVLQVPLTGGAPLTLLSGSEQTIAIAVDTTSVYWNDQHGIYKEPIGGGAIVTLVDAASVVGLASVASMTVTNGNLYFPAPNGPSSDVYAMPAGGGALTTFATGQDDPQAIASDATSIYWTAIGEGFGQGSVVKAAQAGGAPVTLATGLTFDSGAPTLAIGAGRALWADAEDNLVLSVPLAGGLLGRIATDQDTPTSVVADEANVYWTNLGDTGEGNGAILTVPLAGGAPTTIASMQVDPGEILIDETFVYWSSTAGAGLFKTTK